MREAHEREIARRAGREQGRPERPREAGDVRIRAAARRVAVVEHRLPVLEAKMSAAEGREAVGLVLRGVALAPDAEEAEVEKADPASENTFPRQAAPRQIVVEARA